VWYRLHRERRRARTRQADAEEVDEHRNEEPGDAEPRVRERDDEHAAGEQQ
jgi:hypothetical protein